MFTKIYNKKSKKATRILVSILISAIFLFILISKCATNSDPVEYFYKNKSEFTIIVNYFCDNPEIDFDIYDAESEDLKKIDDAEVVNSIKNIISNGAFFDIRNVPTHSSQVKISFVCSNIFVKANDTLAIVYSTETPQDEIIYKGDKVEHVNAYEQIETHWYRKYRK